MLPSRIVVATDGSEAAKKAEMFAAELAVACGTKSVMVVSVSAEGPSLAGAILGPDSAQRKETEEAALAAAAAIRKAVEGHGITVKSKALFAPSPAAAIIAEAHVDGECSHIVMGHRGRGGFQSLLLGSTSHEVAQGAHCPVTIVREEV